MFGGLRINLVQYIFMDIETQDLCSSEALAYVYNYTADAALYAIMVSTYRRILKQADIGGFEIASVSRDL